MSRARDFADLAGSADAGGLTGRNIAINGAMTVAQRSTSVTGITGSGYRTVDRYQININSAGTWSISQSTTAPTGFANSLKLDCTVADASLAAGDFVQIKMHIEGQDLQQLKKGTSDAEAVTASFWVRSAKTGTYIFEIVDGDNNRTISASYSISSADTWEHKTITIPGDTTGTLNNDANSSFQINWWLAAGSNFSSGTLATAWASQTNANRAVGNVNLADSTSNDWYMTGFQLEVGEQATPFEHRSYGDEYLRCLRYTYVWVSGSEYTNITMGMGSGAFDTNITNTRGPVHLPVPMRSSPAISTNGDFRVYSNRAQSQLVPSAISISRASAHTPYMQFTTSSLSQSGGHMIEMGANNDTDAQCIFDAEL